MNAFSEKVLLTLAEPVEDAPVSDQKRLLAALAEQGYDPVEIPLSVLQQLYPLCRKGDITATLVYRGSGWTAVNVESGDTRRSHYGLAVDYGSTTIVMQLVDLREGTVIAQERRVNGQVAYGTDILSRITYTMEDPAHAGELQRATVETFHSLLDDLTEQTGIDARRLPVMILSGNTAMIHFLLKLNAWTVFAAPYAPVTADPGWLWAKEVGMDFGGLLYVIPAASNYVGGDIVSGLLCLEMHKKEEVSLFFDIGTNGELVIGNRDWMLAGAGAAGPALEGYISRFGMRAADGAIDHLQIRDGVLEYTTIGGKKPKGICGSGIIDLLAQMRLAGWINVAGELEPSASERIVLLEEEQQYAVIYAYGEESDSGENLFFAQTDIKQYLDTKAAAYTMVESLMETAGCREEDLDRYYLSGAFAAHSDLESAITIGMFPDLPREKYVRVANSSLEGARLMLLNREKLAEVQWLTEHMYCVQFASIPDFLVRMQAAKFIPHTDMSRYPVVAAKLAK